MDSVQRPTVIGTGLVALDVVVGLDATATPRFYAGGTCGNVLTILSFLGWHSVPVGRLGGEGPAERVRQDLARWKVDLDFLGLEPTTATPMIVERIRRDSTGALMHTFSWSCPQCGSRLPSYAAVPAAAIEESLPRLPRPEVFFFDRVSRGALNLARAANEKGALVFFEPSGVGEPRLFKEALSLAHIVKYSQERMKTLEGWFEEVPDSPTLLEIETMGRGGLRYRGSLRCVQKNRWQSVMAFPVTDFRDAAGSGDWCTAGIVDRLARGGVSGLMKATSEELSSAFAFGQALAAWNCAFEGARGGMYRVSKTQLLSITKAIIDGSTPKSPVPEDDAAKPDGSSKSGICHSCAPKRRSKAAVRAKAGTGTRVRG